MVANVQDARNFLLTTDFPLDKVVLLKSGSQSIGTGPGTIIIPHNLPFIPLVSGSWSLDPSFLVSYEYSSGTFPSTSPTTSIFDLLLDIYADTTNVTVGYQNNGSATTIYYRVYAFQPSDSNQDVPPTASQGDDFILSTDYNYTKLYLNGVINNPPRPSTQVVTHNLGYLPQVIAWETDPLGNRRPLDFSQTPLFSYTNVLVTTTTVEFQVPVLTLTRRIDYRIYLDENS